MRRTIALLASFALILALVPSTLAASSAASTWIVQVHADWDPSASASALARQFGGSVGRVYEHAINGFTFRGSQAAATALARHPRVTLVEPNAEVWLDTTQTNATWGLDRIDQRALPLSLTYTYQQDGTGVTAYVIDSGIRYSHGEFGNRAKFGADFVDANGTGEDCNGHGTHVAGTIGGQTYGVAKDVTLVSVRVFGCDGGSTWDVIIAGIDWAIAHHPAGAPAVANMSLGGGGSSSVDTATNNLIKDGVATAVAAGNGDFLGRQRDACNYSPARVPDAMTISATNSSDAKASWANYGNCVDWFAPGVSITSSWYTSNTATNTISGTSMATPHTAGVAALYLESSPGASPQAVRDAIFAQTTKDIVTSSNTANNDLLYMGFLSGGGGGGTAPTANFTASPTSGSAPMTVQFTDTSTGSPTSWSWNFGDGTSSTVQNPSHTYAAGTFTVALTATNGNGSDGETKSGYILVTTSSGGITLSVVGYKVQGVKRADLRWSGATTPQVDVYRNNALITTTDNDGSHTDNTGQRGGGTNTYRVCEAGRSVCSPDVSVSY